MVSTIGFLEPLFLVRGSLGYTPNGSSPPILTEQHTTFQTGGQLLMRNRVLLAILTGDNVSMKPRKHAPIISSFFRTDLAGRRSA